MNRRLLPVLALPCTLLLCGCLGDVMEVFCEASPDSDHCYQAAAVQEAEPETCDQVSGKNFKGSNPPKDKCFLQIAENTGDPSVCDSIEGGFMSYSKEECLDGVFRNHTVDSCKDAEDQIKCRTAYAKKFGECGDGYAFDKKAQTCAIRPPKEEGSDDAIESKVEGDLTTIADAAKGKYMELLEKAIDDETDPNKLAGLQAYKHFLDKGGEKWEQVNATVDTLKDLKRLFIDAYDPSMNIDRMSVDKILEKGLFDRIKERVFGADKPTGLSAENAQAEDALTVYATMLKRQGEIDFLQKGRKDRIQETIISKAKDQATEKLKDTVKETVEGAAGTAFGAVTAVGDALQAFQDEAQKQMFLGLARAYDRRREALAQQHPNMDPEELHQLTVKQVKEDPYQDNTQLAVVKHGNLLENKDCQDDSNPLCIDSRVWWTAMDKTYVYNHKPTR